VAGISARAKFLVGFMRPLHTSLMHPGAAPANPVRDDPEDDASLCCLVVLNGVALVLLVAHAEEEEMKRRLTRLRQPCRLPACACEKQERNLAPLDGSRVGGIATSRACSRS
jgi:hypothetical protein